MKLLRSLFLILIVSVPLSLRAQEGGEKQKDPPTTRAQRKAERQKWREQRKQEKADRKAVKEHAKMLQDKKTLKRMKRDQRKSDRLNQNRKEFFLIRMFKKKPKGGKP